MRQVVMRVMFKSHFERSLLQFLEQILHARQTTQSSDISAASLVVHITRSNSQRRILEKEASHGLACPRSGFSVDGNRQSDSFISSCTAEN
jgi:hypothetical protein